MKYVLVNMVYGTKWYYNGITDKNSLKINGVMSTIDINNATVFDNLKDAETELHEVHNITSSFEIENAPDSKP